MLALCWVGRGRYSRVLPDAAVGGPIHSFGGVAVCGTGLLTFVQLEQQQLGAFRFRHAMPQTAYPLDRLIELSLIRAPARSPGATDRPQTALFDPCCSTGQCSKHVDRILLCVALETRGLFA